MTAPQHERQAAKALEGQRAAECANQVRAAHRAFRIVDSKACTAISPLEFFMDRYRFIHRFKLGVAEIDTQHAEMADKLHAVSHAFGERDAAALAVRLDELIAFTDGHFRDEEQLLAQADPGGLSEHRRQHVQLSAQLQDLRTRLASDEDPPNANLADSLWVWFGMHILKADRVAADRIRAKRFGGVRRPL